MVRRSLLGATGAVHIEPGAQKLVCFLCHIAGSQKKKSHMFKENLSLSKMERIKLQQPAEFRAIGAFQNCSFDLSVGYSLVLTRIYLLTYLLTYSMVQSFS